MKMFPWEIRTTSIEQSSAGFQHFGQGFEKPRTTTPFHWETNHWPLDFISFLQWHSPSVVPVSQVKGREKENTLTCSVGWFLWYVYKLSLRPNTNYQHDVTKQGLRRDACDQFRSQNKMALYERNQRHKKMGGRTDQLCENICSCLRSFHLQICRSPKENTLRDFLSKCRKSDHCRCEDL